MHFTVRYLDPEKNNITESGMITIITPSCRQNNLKRLRDSIEFDLIDKWIIVYDTSKNRKYNKLFTTNPKILEVYHNEIGRAGHAQRNFGMSLVKDGHIYFLDDDNIIHPDFWAVVAILENPFFYTFDQQRTNSSILKGNCIRLGKIDTAMFIVHKAHTRDILWKKDLYNADGHFISELYSKYRDKHKYIDQVCCYYNYLATPQLPRRVVSFQELVNNSGNRFIPHMIHRPIVNPNSNRHSLQNRIVQKPPKLVQQQSTKETPACPFSRGYRHLEVAPKDV